MKKPLATLSLTLFASSGQGNATQLDVEIINLSHGRIRSIKRIQVTHLYSPPGFSMT